LQIHQNNGIISYSIFYIKGEYTILKNYEISLIRGGSPMCSLPNPVYVPVLLHERTPGESHEEFALRCVAGLDKVFVDMSRNSIERAAVVTCDEVIVTLMAGCGLPKADPAEFTLEPGEGWLIRISAYLWQRGYAFEIIGKLIAETAET
jgi:hypothetical protein